MTHAAASAADPGDITLAYHARTKHRLERYAASPETLDWDMQPNPFREFEGCKRIALPLTAVPPSTRFTDIYAHGCVKPAALSMGSISTFIELSLGLSAWKQY